MMWINISISKKFLRVFIQNWLCTIFEIFTSLFFGIPPNINLSCKYKKNKLFEFFR